MPDSAHAECEGVFAFDSAFFDLAAIREHYTNSNRLTTLPFERHNAKTVRPSDLKLCTIVHLDEIYETRLTPPLTLT